MPPCTMPNSAFAIAARVESARERARPAQRQLHRLRRLVARRGIRRAFVEHHHDVGIEHALDLHRHLRRQEQLVAVDRRRERHAFLVRLLRSGPRLNTWKPPESVRMRPVPAHEAMQPAVRGDDVEPGAQPQVERVAEDDLRADLDELVGRHRLDRAVGADRHEHRRLDACRARGRAGRAGRGPTWRGRGKRIRRGKRRAPLRGANGSALPRACADGGARSTPTAPTSSIVRTSPHGDSVGIAAGVDRRRRTSRNCVGAEVERVLPGAMEVAAEVGAGRADRRIVRRDRDWITHAAPVMRKAMAGSGWPSALGCFQYGDDRGAGLGLVAAGELGAG